MTDFPSSPESAALVARLAAAIERYERRPYSTALDVFSFNLNEKERPLILALLRGAAQTPTDINELDQAVAFIRSIGDELVRAGMAAGDRTVILANIRSLIARADTSTDRGGK